MMINLHEILPAVAEEILIQDILTKYGSWLNVFLLVVK